MVSIASDDVQSIESPDTDADAAATAAAAAAAAATDAAVPTGITTDGSTPLLPITIVVESVIAPGFATPDTASSGPLSAGLYVQAAEAAPDASPDAHMSIPGPHAASL